MNEVGLDLSAPMGVSGAFLHDKPRFENLHKLSAEYCRIDLKLREVDYELKRFNETESLDSFQKQCLRLKRDLEQEFFRRTNHLEQKKAQLLTQREETRKQLDALEPTALNVYHSLSGFVPGNDTPAGISRSSKKENPNVAARNKVIDSLLDLSDREICSELDDAFPVDGQPSPQFVESWFRRFDVKTFIEAYNHKQCRRLVHTMISKRRALRQLP